MSGVPEHIARASDDGEDQRGDHGPFDFLPELFVVIPAAEQFPAFPLFPSPDIEPAMEQARDQEIPTDDHHEDHHGDHDE
jgi:hypothetical protein